MITFFMLSLDEITNYWPWASQLSTQLNVLMLLLSAYTQGVYYPSPELVNVLVRHQILDEDEAIFLIKESLFWGQQAFIRCVSARKVTV